MALISGPDRCSNHESIFLARLAAEVLPASADTAPTLAPTTAIVASAPTVTISSNFSGAFAATQSAEGSSPSGLIGTGDLSTNDTMVYYDTGHRKVFF